MPPTSFSFQFFHFSKYDTCGRLVGLRCDTCGRLGRLIALIWVHMFEYVCICMYICVNVCKCYGNLRVQSTVLDGLQGSFGGPWGVLWGSGGSCGGPRRSGGVLGRAGGVPGRFREGPGGGLKNVIFFFFRGEFVNGLMKY